MIVKTNIRKGKGLAAHLNNRRENDHVEILDSRGFMAEDLAGAVQEINAVTSLTKVEKPICTASLNPPIGAVVTNAHFLRGADACEKAFGLEGQPRIIVMHEKQGRVHAHVVWSRIDTDNMKGIKLPFYKKRSAALSRELYIENGWEMPKGLERAGSRDPRNYNLAEWQQSKRHQLSPVQIKVRLQHCWHRSDSKDAFANALAHEGFFLARGDRRGFVAVDWSGEVHSLSRATGVKIKELTSRLGESKDLRSVDDVKATIKNEQTNLHKQLRTQQARKHAAERAPTNKKKEEMINAQRKARDAQKQFHEKRQREEQMQRQAQYHKGLKGLFYLVTGRYHKQKQLHEAEYQANLARDNIERHQLYVSQRDARAALQVHMDAIKARQQQEIMALNSKVSRHFHGIEHADAPQHQPRQHQKPYNHQPEIGMS